MKENPRTGIAKAVEKDEAYWQNSGGTLCSLTIVYRFLYRISPFISRNTSTACTLMLCTYTRNRLSVHARERKWNACGRSPACVRH